MCTSIKLENNFFYIKIMRSNECCDSKGHIHLKKTLPVKHMRWRVLRFLPE